MAKNLTLQTFIADGTWTAPAGVTSVKIKVYSGFEYFFQQSGDVAGWPDNAGNFWTWGLGSQGGLGNNQIQSFSSPTLVQGATQPIKFAAASLPGGVDNNGDIWTFGQATLGQTGQNVTTSTSIPTVVVGGKKWAKVFSSKYPEGTGAGAIMYAIDTAGDAWAWGYNNAGALGDGTVTGRSSPVQILGSKKFKQISASGGAAHAVGVDTSGVAWAWGMNQSGQVGDNSVVAKSSPVAVVGGKSWKQIVAGGGSSSQGFCIGLDTAGAAWAWGFNGNGQLGDNSVTPRSSPVAVVGGKTWIYVNACGYAATAYGIDSSRDGYAWGGGFYGTLGDGTLTSKSSPVLIAGGKKWLAIAGSGAATYGITTTGEMYAWGRNQAGQLGDATVADKSSPVLVVGPKSWRILDRFLNNEITLTVVPNTAYTVTMKASVLRFGDTIVAQDVLGDPQIIVEYFT